MTKQEKFITDLFDDSHKIEYKYHIPFSVLLAQSALETGWGQSIPNNTNMYFGIKAGPSWKGRRVLITTTEILPYQTPQAAAAEGITFPQIISITPEGAAFKWKVKDWFRAYETPFNSLED